MKKTFAIMLIAAAFVSCGVTACDDNNDDRGAFWGGGNNNGSVTVNVEGAVAEGGEGGNSASGDGIILEGNDAAVAATFAPPIQ